MIRRTPQYQALVEALRDGELTEQTIERFANGVLRRMRPGIVLSGEMALATLAVVLEAYSAQFAEDYLQKLASSRLAELGMALHVARLCLRLRAQSLVRPELGIIGQVHAPFNFDTEIVQPVAPSGSEPFATKTDRKLIVYLEPHAHS